MKRFSIVTSALLAAALFAAASPNALAAPETGKTSKASVDPQKAFDEAQALYDRGKFEEALARFREAYDASQSPNARLLVARCLLALGRTVEAYDELAATRAEAAEKAASQPKYEKTRDSAAADLAALETKVAKVVVTVPDPQGATVTLAGKPLPKERLGVPVTVAPGKITVTVEIPGKPTIQKEETVPAGQTKTILIAAGAEGPAEPITPAPVPAEPPKAPPPTSTTTGGGVRIAGFIVAGLGVAGLGVFGATSMMAKNEFDQLASACGGKRCTDPRYAENVDSGKRLDVIANASLIAGAATIALGGVMIAIGGPKSAAKPEAALRIGPSGASLSVVY